MRGSFPLLSCLSSLLVPLRPGPCCSKASSQCCVHLPVFPSVPCNPRHARPPFRREGRCSTGAGSFSVLLHGCFPPGPPPVELLPDALRRLRSSGLSKSLVFPAAQAQPVRWALCPPCARLDTKLSQRPLERDTSESHGRGSPFPSTGTLQTVTGASASQARWVPAVVSRPDFVNLGKSSGAGVGTQPPRSPPPGSLRPGAEATP